MKTRLTGLFSLATLLTGSAHAEVTGEVIGAQLYYSTNTAVMSAANGGQYTELPCGADLTHGGRPRYFVESLASGNLLPDGYEGSEIIASDEECARSMVIANVPEMRFSTVPHWSPDGTRIAVYAERWDLVGGTLTERGVFLMDVIHDSTGFPIGTENLQLVIPLSGEGLLSWSGDSEWLVYSELVSDGASGSQTDLFLFDLTSGSGFNVTNTPNVSELDPNCSPVDDRIAYSQLVQVRGSFRYDIFTVDVISGTVVQVTSKKTTGSPANRSPNFSPDGQYLSFSSGSITGPITPFDIYKIRSDGSGKAINLTSKKDGDFRFHVWRK